MQATYNGNLFSATVETALPTEAYAPLIATWQSYP
jgi:hypothetical protein